MTPNPEHPSYSRWSASRGINNNSSIRNHNHTNDRFASHHGTPPTLTSLSSHQQNNQYSSRRLPYHNNMTAASNITSSLSSHSSRIAPKLIQTASLKSEQGRATPTTTAAITTSNNTSCILLVPPNSKKSCWEKHNVHVTPPAVATVTNIWNSKGAAPQLEAHQGDEHPDEPTSFPVNEDTPKSEASVDGITTTQHKSDTQQLVESPKMEPEQYDARRHSHSIGSSNDDSVSTAPRAHTTTTSRNSDTADTTTVITREDPPNDDAATIAPIETYHREEYVFHTPPVEATDDEQEKKRRREALAKEQQQMILERVQAARLKQKAVVVKPAIQERRSTPSAEQSANPVSKQKRLATTSATNGRSGNTASSRKPRTRGQLYRRQPAGQLVNVDDNRVNERHDQYDRHAHTNKHNSGKERDSCSQRLSSRTNNNSEEKSKHWSWKENRNPRPHKSSAKRDTKNHSKNDSKPTTKRDTDDDEKKAPFSKKNVHHKTKASGRRPNQAAQKKAVRTINPITNNQ